MGLGSTWRRYLAWSRGLKTRSAAVPRWEAGMEPFVGFLQTPNPDLEDGEEPVLASLSSVSRGWWDVFRRGEGALWLTSRRLIFQHQRIRMPLAPGRIDIPRSEIESVCRRSVLRSILGTPFMRGLQVRTLDRKTYIFQVMGAQQWVAELERTTSNRKEG